MNYIVKHTTVYPGGHAQDPGYRSTVVIDGSREYAFLSHPDGSNVRRVETRRADDPAIALNFRRCPSGTLAKRRAGLEAAIKAYLAQRDPHIEGERPSERAMRLAAVATNRAKLKVVE